MTKKYVWVIQGWYADSYGWEDVCEENTSKEAMTQKRLYDENEPQYAHRLIRRRVEQESET